MIAGVVRDGDYAIISTHSSSGAQDRLNDRVPSTS
jgi:hypothetical protein